MMTIADLFEVGERHKDALRQFDGLVEAVGLAVAAVAAGRFDVPGLKDFEKGQGHFSVGYLGETYVFRLDCLASELGGPSVSIYRADPFDPTKKTSCGCLPLKTARIQRGPIQIGGLDPQEQYGLAVVARLLGAAIGVPADAEV